MNNYELQFEVGSPDKMCVCMHACVRVLGL